MINTMRIDIDKYILYLSGMVTENSIHTVADLITSLGGPAAFARLIGVTTEHASLMKRRQSIPVGYWPALIESSPAKVMGLSADDILGIHANPPEHSSAPTQEAAE